MPAKLSSLKKNFVKLNLLNDASKNKEGFYVKICF